MICSICNVDIEDNNHLFMNCSVAVDLWKFLGNWCDIFCLSFLEIEDIVPWIDSLNISLVKRSGLEAIVMIMW